MTLFVCYRKKQLQSFHINQNRPIKTKQSKNAPTVTVPTVTIPPVTRLKKTKTHLLQASFCFYRELLQRLRQPRVKHIRRRSIFRLNLRLHTHSIGKLVDWLTPTNGHAVVCRKHVQALTKEERRF